MIMYQTVPSEHRKEFWEWCDINDIVAEYDYTGYEYLTNKNIDTWRLQFEDEELETFIKLRWA